MKDKKFLIGLILGLLFMFILTPLLGVGLSFYHFLTIPCNKNDKLRVVSLSSGSTFKDIVKTLAEDGIICHPLLFTILARYKEVSTKIKAGEYELSGSMLPEEILEAMVQGKVKFYTLTIPEGYNMYQISSLIERNGLGSAEEFLKLVRDSKWVKKLGIDGDTLEGYLFPDTYSYTSSTNLKDFVLKMVKNFKRVFTSDMAKRAKEMGLTVREVVILASIIEKETGADQERTLISAVFHNRLKKGMRLESDPTAIYGMGDFFFKKKLKSKDLRVYTPYNTYKINGLPPGPIANPGEASLKAVLYPAKEKYLFFVSKNDGTHFFSVDYKDHLKAIDNYQKRR